MNTTNFSIARVAKFAKSEILSQRRMWLLWWGTLALVMLVFYLWNAYNAGPSSQWALSDVSLNMPVVVARSMIVTMTIFVMMMLVSRSFINYLHPQSATRFLMLPVSKAEQFSFIVLFYFIVVPFIIFVTQFVIDFGFATYYHMPNLIQSTFTSTTYFTVTSLQDNVLCSMVVDKLFLLTMFSLFLYGGILFRRNNFVMTCLAMFGVVVVLGMVGVLVGEVLVHNLPSGVDEDVFLVDLLRGNIGVIAICGLTMISAVMLFLSYRRFRNFQITK